MKTTFIKRMARCGFNIGMLGVATIASAQQTPQGAAASPLAPPAREIPIYPGVAPGSEKWAWTEAPMTSGRPVGRNVVRPVLQYYPADKSKAVGTAVIVAPGGGFNNLMMSYEGVDIAKRLNEMGIDSFVLKYRTRYLDATGGGGRGASGTGGRGAGAPAAQAVPGGRGSNALPGSLPAVRIGHALTLTTGPGQQEPQDVEKFGESDGLQAIRVLRQHAAEFGVQPDRIGIIGFSAGGAVVLATVSAEPDARPNFAMPIYPHIDDPILPPTTGTAPPLFIAVAADDQNVGFQNSIDLFGAWRKAGIPAELHIFQTGRHGFLTKGGGADHFMDRLEEWLKLNDLLTKAAH